MSNYLTEEITEVVQQLCGKMLELHVTTTDYNQAFQAEQVALWCVIEIGGPWTGALQVECSTKFAQTLAQRMFGVKLDLTNPECVEDALREFTNILGGNVKRFATEANSNISESATLQFPKVFTSDPANLQKQYPEVLSECFFLAENHPLAIRVNKRGETHESAYC